jgi:hypothetical protein
MCRIFCYNDHEVSNYSVCEKGGNRMDTTKILEGIYSIQKTVELMDKRLTSVENKRQSVEIKMDLLT